MPKFSMSLLLLFLLIGTMPVMSQQFFADIATTDEDRDAITEMVSCQLMEGYPDGTFSPDVALRHADGVMLMARLLNTALKGFMIVPAQQPSTAQSIPMPKNHWAFHAANFLAEHGMLDSEWAQRRGTAVTRLQLLMSLSRLLHGGLSLTPEFAMQEFTDTGLLPPGWREQNTQPVTRRETARLLDQFLYYLTQHAVTEGTILAFETDTDGYRWVHVQTNIGEARLALPVNSVVVQNGTEDQLREGMAIRTVSDAVSSMNRAPFYRVREVTVLPMTTAQR